ETWSQTLRMPVRRHEGRCLQEILGPQRPASKAYVSFGGLKSGQRPHQFGLAIPFHPRDTDDLPPRDLETYVVESPAAQGLHGKDHIVDGLCRLRRERRPESPPDDHAQELRIGN